MIEARFIKSTCHPSHITADVWTVWKGMAAEGGFAENRTGSAENIGRTVKRNVWSAIKT